MFVKPLLYSNSAEICEKLSYSHFNSHIHLFRQHSCSRFGKLIDFIEIWKRIFCFINQHHDNDDFDYMYFGPVLVL